MAQKIRRVVTGHDERGRSVVISDGYTPNVKEIEIVPGLVFNDLWETRASPADNFGNEDAADRPITLEPPRNGTIFRVVEFPPDSRWRDEALGKAVFEPIAGGHTSDAGSGDPMMHKTTTLDYLIVLKGEIWAVLEEGDVCLKQGDVMVQRGTNHSWSVRTDEPCLLAAILVNAKPI